MARIAGIDLPKNKRGEIGLTYIYGIGRSLSQKILTKSNVDWNIKVSEWNDEQLNAIRSAINEIKVEGTLRSEVQLNIKRLMDIGCYRGVRHTTDSGTVTMRRSRSFCESRTTGIACDCDAVPA